MLIVLSGCKSKKTTTRETEQLRSRTAGFLLKRYEENKFDHPWVGMKIDASSTVNGESQSFKATLRMQRDSAIWISISPLLGIEMIRILVTPDTLKYLSKIPDNKYYFIGSVDVLNRKLGVNIDFDMLQEVLLGNAIGLEKDEGRFRSELDENNYLLISRYRRQVRRMVGVDDRKLENDSIIVDPNDPKYQRSLRKLDNPEGIIVSRYWIEPDNYRLVKSLFNDVIHQRTMEIRYSKFLSVNNQWYPSVCNFSVADPKGKVEVNYEITKMNAGKEYDFPFEIPSDYARRDSL